MPIPSPSSADPRLWSHDECAEALRPTLEAVLIEATQAGWKPIDVAMAISSMMMTQALNEPGFEQRIIERARQPRSKH